jgi:desulfoferrodoxin (superoxide reductase-like protein)
VLATATFLVQALAITSPEQLRVDTLVANTSAAGTGPTLFSVATATAVKHDSFITISGSTATISVRGTDGSTTSLHPQGAGHFISDIWVKDQTGEVIYYAALADSAAAPTTTFTVPAGTTSLTPFEFCNQHG